MDETAGTSSSKNWIRDAYVGTDHGAANFSKYGCPSKDQITKTGCSDGRFAYQPLSSGQACIGWDWDGHSSDTNYNGFKVRPCTKVPGSPTYVSNSSYPYIAGCSPGTSPVPVVPIVPVQGNPDSHLVSVHFILGGGMNEAGYQSLAKAITDNYSSFYSGTIHFHHFSDDISSELQQIPAGVQIVLIGHSFGAYQAIQIARKAAPRVIDRLIAIDAVYHDINGAPWYHLDSGGNFVADPYSASVNGRTFLETKPDAFLVSSNVVEAVNAYRGAVEPPYSSAFWNKDSATIHSYNEPAYPPVGFNAWYWHGAAVWNGVAYEAIKKAVKGKSMFSN